MEFNEFLDNIYQRHSSNVKLGLERMFSILADMDDPHLKLHGIHIAGTNGKGSTAAIIEAMGIAHHLKTGLNTSPHLVEYNERIRFGKKNISNQELMDTYLEWQSSFEKYEASFFEITTAMAFYLFYKHNLDLSIFEVGLGGRLDGTNPFKSTVTAITSISYDHPKSLGDSVEKIAMEKAGIIKENTPLILGKIKNIPANIIKNVAKSKNVSVFEYGKDFKIENIQIDKNKTIFDYISTEIILKRLSLNLIGVHQAYNAAVAITSFIKFMEITNRKVEQQAIRQGLQNILWFGRMQIIHKKPLVIIDGAHNEEGIEALIDNLRILFPQKKIHFVIAILRDKKIENIIKMICSVSYKVYISKNSSTRAAEIEEQAVFVKKYTENYSTVSDVLQAYELAINEASDEDIIVISGSLYTISEILEIKKIVV